EAQFRGWTADWLVRQAAFKGVREDKSASEVIRELPAIGDAQADVGKAVNMPAKTGKTATKRSTSKPRRGAERASPTGRASAWKNGDVRFTHPDRVYWVDVGITK